MLPHSLMARMYSYWVGWVLLVVTSPTGHGISIQGVVSRMDKWLIEAKFRIYLKRFFMLWFIHGYSLDIVKAK